MSSQRERDEQRLSILEGLVTAMERRSEVFELIANAPDPDAAQRSLATSIGLNDLQARAVLDAQLRIFTLKYQVHVTTDRDELREALRPA